MVLNVKPKIGPSDQNPGVLIDETFLNLTRRNERS